VVVAWVFVWWARGADPWQGVAGLCLGLLVATLSWALGRHEALPPGTLAWDGEGWCYEPSQGKTLHGPVSVHVLWDTGAAMLVGIRAAGESAGLGCVQRFAWLRASQWPERWHAWRCAVYAKDIL
jgi:hypothetical protein